MSSVLVSQLSSFKLISQINNIQVLVYVYVFAQYDFYVSLREKWFPPHISHES